jgi:hypothetical protein
LVALRAKGRADALTVAGLADRLRETVALAAGGLATLVGVKSAWLYDGWISGHWGRPPQGPATDRGGSRQTCRDSLTMSASGRRPESLAGRKPDAFDPKLTPHTHHPVQAPSKRF